MNDSHPGYLMFKDEQADIEELKEQGIDDSYLVVFKKHRTIAALAKLPKEGWQPFCQCGTGGARGAGAAQRQPLGPLPIYQVAPASFIAPGGALGASPALFQPQLGSFGLAPRHSGFGPVATPSLPGPQQCCHHCKQYGHFQRNCPYLLKYVGGDRSTGPLAPCQ
uniref:CCHC-type domain-containing protein n=1 Tax=Plectus sambesii TaxID=2011161 RepID=A0A914WN55_9BILA